MCDCIRIDERFSKIFVIECYLFKKKFTIKVIAAVR